MNFELYDSWLNGMNYYLQNNDDDDDDDDDDDLC